jgi:hypothetical protein
MTAEPEAIEEMGALTIAKARYLIDRLCGLGFRAHVDHGALLISDTTGQRRDLSRFISPALVFETLNRGLDEDPALVDPRGL